MLNPTDFPSKFMRTFLLFAFLLLLFLSASFYTPADAQGDNEGLSGDGLWTEVDERSLSLVGERWIIPQYYRTLVLNNATLEDLLAQAPLEFSPEAQDGGPVISLPMPDGAYGRFRFVEAPIMAPELAAKFPQIKTYLGKGLDDPYASVRFDRTPAGFHAMVFSGEGMVFIDPYSRGDVSHYISYFKKDYAADPTEPYEEMGPLGDPGAIQPLVDQLRAQGVSSDGYLRTYRAAVAATGEYTQFHGGTVVDGMAAIVTTMNRVVGIYEKDVAVRMVLVANNDQIVYTNGSTDPYNNNNGSVMLSQNQSNLDAVIGDANYDIGHAFSTGGGGIAYLGVPCKSGFKALGVTGRSAPVGDPFDVDYVAHEMGHQYGANHPFNGNEGSCAGSNRNAATAYEPGSGSTIMAYAGICGSQDLQPNSDDYFHGISLDEINAYITLGSGNSCPAKTATGNLAPVVDAGTGGFSIPINTPFSLTGSATDGNGDPLTFTWEQFDLGPAGHPDSPSGGAPIFRSFKPVSDPTRTIPKLDDLLNNTHTIGELLPTYSRTLTFRLTARDNHNYPNGGRTGNDTISFSVTSAAGPFLVTAPNTAVTWVIGTQETVTWDVADTTSAPVSCSNVDISLSTDGGYTYPRTLEAGTPNDGSQSVTIPNAPTTNARVKVTCSNNIFFDISNLDFIINGIQFYFPVILK
jgi:hypothetical protein